jgi:hypothetical protein
MGANTCPIIFRSVRTIVDALFRSYSHDYLSTWPNINRLFSDETGKSAYHLNLLDTPGHQDFSEDTYRTLAAADNCVRMITTTIVSPALILFDAHCR